MTITPKHTKLLTIAATNRGAPMGLYMNEAAELVAAGMLEARETFSAVGARNLRLFRVEA